MEYVFEDYDEMVRCYRDQAMITKEQVINGAISWKARWAHQSKEDTKHSSAYYAVLDRLMDVFIAKLKDTVLFDAPEGTWQYNIAVSSEGIKLLLIHDSAIDFEDDGNDIYPVSSAMDQAFTMVSVNTKLLSVDEYAALYGVEPVTARQWIRRGKLRTAKKYGREWRIPELTEITGRGYEPVTYEWQQELNDVPEEYRFLVSGNCVYIYQDKEDKSKYHVDMANGHKSLVDTKERERLELFLISHPMVKCASDEFGNFA